MIDANTPFLRRVSCAEISKTAMLSLDDATLQSAREIVNNVRTEGEVAIRRYVEKFEQRKPGTQLTCCRREMQEALDTLDSESRAILERTAQRIQKFAEAQHRTIREMSIAVAGGEAGHTIEPIESAGCYAPAGRYPLVSSVLMTAITARIAGCLRVVVTSPSTSPIMLAAAAIADADEFLVAGGAHSIAAMAYGFTGFEPCDMIVGPGNKWVTAAKHIVSNLVGIDMLAGPSELLVLADESADPALIASDLLAQAEHDEDARVMLVTDDVELYEHVERQIEVQLEALPTGECARRALTASMACVAQDMDTAIQIVNRLAPEHVEIMTANANGVASRIRNAGAIFIGAESAQVCGDFGAGPNHTLPTSGTARFQAGLSVLHFLRLRTWLRITDIGEAREFFSDVQHLAAFEGLPGHAVSAKQRSRI